MKSFILALGVLLLCSTLVGVNAFIVHHQIQDIYRHLLSIPPYPQSSQNSSSFLPQTQAIAKLEEEWDNKLTFLSFSLSHDDLQEVTTLLSQLRGAADVGAADVYAIYYHALKTNLLQISQSSVLHLGNVF